MTIPAELYEQINNELIEVIDKHHGDLTQYDMLQIAVNLIVSYIDVVEKFDNVPRHKIVDEVITLIHTRNASDFMSGSTATTTKNRQ